MDTRDGRVENGRTTGDHSPPRLSVCHPRWASDSLHMFVHNCLKLLGTLLFILGSIAAQPPQATALSGRGPSGMNDETDA